MRTIVSIIPLLVCIALIMPLSAFGKRPGVAPVVAKFGGECYSKPFPHSPRGVFSDRPARLRGTFTAWFFYIHRRSSTWSELSTYTRDGGDRGVIATLANRTGRYAKTSGRTELGDYRDPQAFLTRMGVPNCEVSGTAPPNKAPCS